MDEPYTILDSALRSRYLSPEELPAAPLWGRLPAELRAAIAAMPPCDEPFKAVLYLIPRVPCALPGKSRRWTEEEQNRGVSLELGLIYLAYVEGRIGVEETLTRAFHVADSYVCNVAARPFLRLRSALNQDDEDGGRMAELFGSHVRQAAWCVKRWGLRPGGLPPGERPGEVPTNGSETAG